MTEVFEVMDWGPERKIILAAADGSAPSDVGAEPWPWNNFGTVLVYSETNSFVAVAVPSFSSGAHTENESDLLGITVLTTWRARVGMINIWDVEGKETRLLRLMVDQSLLLKFWKGAQFRADRWLRLLWEV